MRQHRTPTEQGLTDQGAQLSGRPAAILVPAWVPKEAVLTQGGVARQIVSVACTRTDVSHRATAARRVPENQFFRRSYEASNLPVERARGMADGVVKLGGRAAHRHVRVVASQ